MTCSCGYVFTEADAFCVHCGRQRPSGAPPSVAQPSFAQPLVVPQPPADPSPFDSDAVYLQKTLRHEPMELGLDDSVSLRSLAIMVLRAYVVWAFASILFIPLIVEQLKSDDVPVAIFAFLIDVLVFWAVLLGSKVTEPIGEWRALLADRAEQADTYYGMIDVVLDRRQLPIERQRRRIRLRTNGRPVKNTLVLSDGSYQTYVTVFPYGTSLYVGWQMWRRRSGAQLVKRALHDRMTGANLVTSMLRTDRARAVREAVHLACREAVYATPNESLWAQAQQRPLPQIEEESALLPPRQAASPALPPPSATIAAPSSDPTPTSWQTPAPPRPGGPVGRHASAPSEPAAPSEVRYE